MMSTVIVLLFRKKIKMKKKKKCKNNKLQKELEKKQRNAIN
jgi:hypothetical protein